MLRIAHIVQPVAAAASSDLVIAQPITFASMRIAREVTAKHAEVTLLAAQMQGEQRQDLPGAFLRTADLTCTVGDRNSFLRPRRLPLIRDILDRLFAASPQADYLIYSNVDIALQPHFYLAVVKLIEQGHRAFIVNRRTITNRWHDPADLPLMWAELGEAHPGWDCFIFPRNLYPRFILGDVCIGAGWFGRALLANMACLEPSFKVFTDLHLTFHLGNERTWQHEDFGDYIEHNRQQCRFILEHFEHMLGPFEHKSLPWRFQRKLNAHGPCRS